MKTRVSRLLAVAIAAGVLGLSHAEAPSPASIDDTKSVVGKWVATQELIYKERKSWQQEKDLLQSRIELIEKESSELEKKLAESRKVLGELNARRGAARTGQQQFNDLGGVLAAKAGDFERTVRTIYDSLPAPAREKVDALYRRMPADPEHTNVSVAERYQNVLGILNEVNKMNGEITLATEVRPLSDGKPSEVKTVYLGLAQAYFISAQGEAGIGRPGPNGWEWQPANELSHDINVVIQVLQNQTKPIFVPLPVSIQ